MKTCFIICGPTAVGKTNLSLQLAHALNTSIISADSRQCYRELGIGVAKPSAKELALVPHYFINSHSIFEEVNAAGFERYAEASATEIFSNHKAAVMVGGTGLYIDAFCNGLDAIPAINPSIREAIREQYQLDGIEWLRSALQEADPMFASNGEMFNPQRMMRALEVFRSTGNSIRSYQQSPEKRKLYTIVKIGLEFPREELYQRINHRVDDMVTNGLVDEVRGLLPYKHLNALNTVGYKEIISLLEGEGTLVQAIENIKQNTRRYAKRQLTWFKKDESVRWFTADLVEEIVHYCIGIAKSGN